MSEKVDVLLRSVIEQDTAAVVICDLEHTIVYMNPKADRQYSKWGGAAKLMGSCIFDCHNPQSIEKIKKVVAWFAQSKENNQTFTHHSEKENRDEYMVALRDAEGNLVGYYEKHEYRNAETDRPYSFMNM